MTMTPAPSPVLQGTPKLCPAGAFGSYDPAEVTWLLTDLSHVPLEAPAEDREEQMQGGGHYSESLPVEYQPDPAYLRLYEQALADSAGRVAVAVAVLGTLLMDAHWTAGYAAGRSDLGFDGHRQPPVLVSLARAGTPVGILLKRWLATRGVDAPHYAVSIIRGKGIDTAALGYVLARHPAGAVRFVDGWTGKGAIQRQLHEAVAAWKADHPEHAALDGRLAVLADPGSCTDLFGTRDDFLIPSACLNSTVSGLVSRTVHRPDLTPPGSFHGAKFYAELAPQDVSAAFLDAITAAAPAPGSGAVSGVAVPLVTDPVGTGRAPTWAGWAAVERLAGEFGITDLNLVKPGVGETTRVLLRRVPWQVLVRPDRAADLRHVLALAADRGVPVVERADLPYTCVGLIRPVDRA